MVMDVVLVRTRLVTTQGPGCKGGVGIQEAIQQSREAEMRVPGATPSLPQALTSQAILLGNKQFTHLSPMGALLLVFD